MWIRGYRPCPLRRFVDPMIQDGWRNQRTFCQDVVRSIGADVDNDGSNGGTDSAVAGAGVGVSGLPAMPSSAKIC